MHANTNFCAVFLFPCYNVLILSESSYGSRSVPLCASVVLGAWNSSFWLVSYNLNLVWTKCAWYQSTWTPLFQTETWVLLKSYYQGCFWISLILFQWFSKLALHNSVQSLLFCFCRGSWYWKMTDSGDLCPHLDSIGEVTKEELTQKSKVWNAVLLILWCFILIMYVYYIL